MANGSRKIRHELEMTGEQKYKAGLKSIETGLKNNKAAMTALNAEYGKGDKSIEGLSKRQALLTEKLDQQRQKMALIKAEYDKVVAAQGANSERAQELARDYDYARAAAARTEKELAELNKTTEKATSRIEQFKAKLKEGGGELEKLGKKISDAGSKISKFTTVPIVAGFAAATKAAADFESAIAKLDVITRGELGAENMSRGLIQASNELGEAVGGLAEAQYQAISAGIEAGDSLEYTVAAAKAAKAGYADVTTVVKGSTSVINAWKMSASEIPSMFDKLILSLDLGKAELEELASQMGQITGLAPQVGVSFDEVLAATAALTMNGQQTSSAINGLKNIMAGVIKPTKQAQDEAKALGLQFNAAALRSKGLAAFLQEVMDKTGGSEEKFSRLFGSVEGLSSALLLTGNASDAFKSNLVELASAGGTVDRVLSRIGQTQAQRFQKSWNQMQNATIQFGQTLSPIVDSVSGIFQRLADAASGLSDDQMRFAAGLAAVTAAIGPTVVGIGKLLSAFSQIKTATAALSALVGGGGVLAGIALGIAGVTAGVVALKNHMDSIKPENKIKATFAGMKVDTSAIDTAIANAEGVTYDLELTAAAKIKLSNDSTDLHNQIVAWLTDGKKETQEQKEEYKNKADEVVAPLYEAIQASFDEKKKTLDEQLSAGILDKATYDARLEELKTTTTATKNSLQTEADQYKSYVLYLATLGKQPTEEQLAKLEELRQKIVEVGNSILEAQNTALQASKASYSLVAGGGGTKEDIVKAVAYLQTDLQVKKDTLDHAHQQAMADLQTQLDQAETPEAKQKIRLDMELETQNYEDAKDELAMQYSEMLSAMIDGMAKKYPEQAEKLREIAEKQSLVQELKRAIIDVSSEDPETFEAGQAVLDSLYEQIFGETNFTGNNMWAISAVDDLKSQINEALNSEDFATGIFSDFSTALEKGAANGLDTSGVSETLKSLITAYDLTDDGKTVGEQLIDGEIQGINDNQGDLNQAILDSVNKGNEILKNAQGIHSPSTVWEGFGTNMMQGLANGISTGYILVNVQNLLLASRMKQAGKDSIQGLINGAESKRTDLVNKFKDLALDAWKSAKKELEIESPSKKFAELGRYSGEGMIKGLQATQRRVQDVMSQVVDTRRSQAVARTQPQQHAQQPTANADLVVRALTGMFQGANLYFNDKLDARAFMMEAMGIIRSDIVALGGMP